MIISQARIAFESEHRAENHQSEITEKDSRQAHIRRTRRRRNRQILQSVMVDRISLSRQEKKQTMSNYSAQIRAQSQVTSIETGAVDEHVQAAVMEKIVGGIIDKDVAIQRISRNEDVQFPEEAAITPETLGEPYSDPSSGLSIEPQQATLQSHSIRASEVAIKRTKIHFEEENTRFSSEGQVVTQDGRVIDFSLDMSLDRSFLSRTEEQTLIQRWQEEINLTDPLVISLDGQAPALTDSVFEFDLDGDGNKDLINFAATGSGFLTLDKNGDSVVNDGSELFGPGTGNGFNELAAYDEDQNRWIDENDAVFSKLKVWTKDDQGTDQLISLKEAGIGAIALDHANTLFNMTGQENRLNGQMKQSGVFLFENGEVGSIHQVDLVSHEPVKLLADPIPELRATEPSLIPEGPSLQAVPAQDSAQPEPLPNPLQELLDRIEELREKLTQYLDKMRSGSGRRPAMGKQRLAYQDFNPDPSILINGDSFKQRSQRWWA